MPTKLLVVDDSPTILSLLTMGLSQKGYKVITAENGLDALKMLAKWPVDLVVTDLNMPEMDGLTLLGRIRRENPLTHLPVVVLSTEGEDHDIQRAIQAGADLYLTKPIAIDKLDAELRAIMDKKKAGKKA